MAFGVIGIAQAARRVTTVNDPPIIAISTPAALPLIDGAETAIVSFTGGSVSGTVTFTQQVWLFSSQFLTALIIRRLWVSRSSHKCASRASSPDWRLELVLGTSMILVTFLEVCLLRHIFNMRLIAQ